ncbi:MAG: transporter substrate-binding domain-containing protein [Spirochaetales bacterium]|nr:transporter substrate-binding domain-containing protein [Spirochaetales bacterium]MCF7939441.1 transporter substrate-binding domain-containing protein [Spirochaetales bacterium]
MKKIIFLGVVILIAAVILLFSLTGLSVFRTPETKQVFVPLSAEEKGAASAPGSSPGETYIAMGDWGYPPFEYLNEDGLPEGFNIDILSRIAEIMNMDIRISLGPWKVVRNELKEGEIDLLAGMYKTGKREKNFDFSIPHFMASYGVFVPEGSAIHSLQDLEDKRILVQVGDLAHDYLLENEIGGELVPVDEWTQLIPALLEGEADCAVMGMVQGVRILREEGYGGIRVLSQPLLQRPYCIAVQEGDDELLSRINEGLNLLKTSGEYDRIYQKWFAVYEKSRLFSHPLVKILAGGILVLGVVLFVIVLWSHSLRKQVRKQTADLRTTLEELRQANSTKNRFLAGVSHELRTPLHGIMGMSRLLEETGLDSRQQELLSLMKKASEQLNRVLSDLIDISRLDTGQLSIERSRFSLNSLSTWLEPILQKNAGEKGLAFDISICGRQDAVLFSDKDRIAQILINLTDNAVKNTNAGEVKLHLVYPAEKAPDSGDGGLKLLEIRVEDTGKGIAQEDLEGVFAPFTRGKGPSGERASGLGLGLSIVQSITDLLGGTVDVESTVGAGSAFRVRLPVEEVDKDTLPESGPAQNQEIPADHQAVEALPGTAPRDVLIAEDEGINRLYLESLMRKEGWNTTAAATGLDVLKKAEDHSFDLILMDLSMPEMGGLEAAGKIRSFEAENGRPKTPMIALTAHAYEANKQECIDAGMDGFVSKPFHERGLWKEIKRVLSIS